MSAQVPPMYWFIFWVGLSVGILSFGFFMAVIIHRANMKTLEILRAYAEKGMEPPLVVIEALNRQRGESHDADAGRELGRKAGNFTGLLVSAGVSGGIAWWAMNQGAPQWVVYLFGCLTLFWGVRAISYLFAAFVKSEK